MIKINFSKETIKSILNRIVLFLKETKSLPNFWLYIVLSFILFIFFLFVTFPYEVLIRDKLNSVGSNFGKSFYIGSVDFSMIGDSDISRLMLGLENGAEYVFKDIKMNVGIFSALLGSTIGGDMTINNFNYKKDETSLTGLVKSDFNLEFKSYAEFPSGGFIKIKLENVQIEGLTIKDFNIPPVNFTLVDADIKIVNKSLGIREMKLSGPDINGTIKGDIIIAKMANASRMNLTLEIDPKSKLLENYKILLGDAINNDMKVTITLRGTISNPQIGSVQTGAPAAGSGGEGPGAGTSMPDRDSVKSFMNNKDEEPPE